MMEWITAALAGAITGVLSGFGHRRRVPATDLYDQLCWRGAELSARHNLLYFLPTAATALPAHVKNGYIEKAALLPQFWRAWQGTALAAWAATAMEVGMLRKCFGVFLLVIGVRELFRK